MSSLQEEPTGLFARLWNRANLGRKLVLLVPFLWMGIFFLLPFFIILKISFAEAILSRPPFSSIFSYDTDTEIVQFALNLGNYLFLLEDSLYFKAYFSSLKIAAFSTVFALLIGYPMALAIARSRPSIRPILLMLVVMPFLTSFLIRVYAWIGLMKREGLINEALLWLGIIDQPITMLQTDFAIYVGIVYSYLPFMILPLYATLERMDGTLLEAAADLGSRPYKAFLKVTLPLSKPGVIAGCMLVFIPVVGEFVIPSLLGGSNTLMIGRVLWDEFFSNRDWPMASAVAFMMLLFLIIPIKIFQNSQASADEP